MGPLLALVACLPEPERRKVVDTQVHLFLQDGTVDTIRRALPPEALAAFNDFLSKLQAWR